MSLSVAAVSAYNIVKVPAITIDGNLSEWTNIASISMADNSSRTGGVNNTAKVKLAWDATYLYAAYDVTDTELLALQTQRDNGSIYQDDEIELYIDPQADGASATSMTTTDYQLLVNVRNTLGDLKGNGSGGKDANYYAASFVSSAVVSGTVNASGTDVGYKVELRIAWTDLGVSAAAGNFIRIDAVVGDRDGTGATIESFDWANLPLYNNPSGWKDVKLIDPPPPVSAYDLIGVPSMTIDGNLSDWAGVAAISMADQSGRAAGLDNSAKVKLAWNPTYLYFAYDVTDTELLALQTTRDHGSIYLDDEVELYIDPQRDGSGAASMTSNDYQFLANVREALGDNRGDGVGGKDAIFNAASFLVKAATNGTLNATGADIGYKLEGRIAWTDLGVVPAAGNFMRIDPVVGDRDGAAATIEAFDWAGLSSYNDPSGWKDVKLVIDATPPTAPTNLVLTVISSSQINVSWTASASPDGAKYNIYRATTGTPILYKTVSSGPYQDTGLTPATSYTYQVSTVDAAGNESAKTASVSASTSGAQALGIPFGPYTWWTGLTRDTVGAASFGTSIDFTDAGVIVNRISVARSSGLKLFLMMTDAGHSAATGPYKIRGYFNLAKWKTAMDTYNTPAIKAAVDSGVADGTILGNSVMDEPNNSTNPDGTEGWGPDGWMTKMTVDSMCRYAKSIFPTLPMGVVVVHWWKESTDSTRQPTQRPRQTYTDCEFIIDQYDWWQQSNGPHSPGGRGDVGQWKDSALVAATRNRISIAFSMNILNGGVTDVDPPIADPQPCPVPPTGGPGTISSGCRMTAAQTKQYGLTLGPLGCAMLMWRYDQPFMSKTDSRQAFADIAADLANRPAKSCRRPT